MNIKNTITDLIGGTPLLELANIEKSEELNAKIIAKLEYFNPAGSVKDRVAKAMIDDAEEKGILKPDECILSENRLCEQYRLSRRSTRKALDNLVAQGMLGTVIVAVFAAGVLILFAKTFKRINSDGATELFMMFSVLFAIAGSSMVTSLVFYYFSQNSILFWAFLGLAVRLLECKKGENANDK